MYLTQFKVHYHVPAGECAGLCYINYIFLRQVANAGFSFDYQLVNVPDFNGVGESQPSPFFYQNLAEAEYVVAVYMYMRLIGKKVFNLK